MAAKPKTYRYVDQGGEHDVTRTEILKTYYPWWKKQMRKVDKHDQISPRNCVEDWIVVHWAWEI